MSDGGATEREWQAERRSFAAQRRDELAAERERLANARDQQAEERQRAADRRHADAASRADGHFEAGAGRDTGFEGREVARLARKTAAEMRAEAAESRHRAEAARRAARMRYPLAARFAELAGHLFAAGGREEVLARLLAAAVDVIDGADMASISLVRAGGALSTRSGTDPVALRLDELQYRTGEGPCLETSAVSGPLYLAVPEINLRRGWPTFGPLAGRLGIRSALAIALLAPAAGHSGRPDHQPRLGSLNLYARERAAFDDGAIDAALLLAAHAAVALASSAQASQLREALDNRDVIGQAKGILMVRRQLSAEEAFDVLRRTSQRLNLKLRDVAARIAETRAVPPAE
jgi:hypothetical protein